MDGDIQRHLKLIEEDFAREREVRLQQFELAKEQREREHELLKEQRRLLIPSQVEDLKFVENWINDGFRIGRRYIQHAQGLRPELKKYQDEDLRKLKAEYGEWTGRSEKSQSLAFRLDPPTPVHEEKPNSDDDDELPRNPLYRNLYDAVSSMQSLMNLLTLTVKESGTPLDTVESVLGLTYRAGTWAVERVRERLFAGQG
jgi:hypothetical protein